MIEIYEEASRAAYKNCLELLEDANLLHDHGRYPRSYALAVICAEEFAKSFLYKCYSCGIIIDKDFRRDILKHGEKIFHFTHIMASFWTFASKHRQIVEAVEHDKKVQDHSEHQLPKVLASIDPLPVEIATQVFDKADQNKMHALYVDFKENKILAPSKMIDQPRCEIILKLLNIACYGFEVFLKDNDEEFAKGINFLSPSILSGTIKSDTSKFRKKPTKKTRP